MSRDALETLLSLTTLPVAISFLPHPPDGVRRVARSEPAGCGYWRLAAEGNTFYTEAADHLGCPIGAHTHNVPMSSEKAAELQGLVQIMVGLEYLTMHDVASLPRRTDDFGVAVYAPLASAPLAPDVIMIRGNARQLMLLAEAGAAAGVAGAGPVMGRPTCAVVPEVIASAHTAASFGCVGNRVYTGATDDEAWFAIPGERLALVVEKLSILVKANAALEAFHAARKAQPS